MATLRFLALVTIFFTLSFVNTLQAQDPAAGDDRPKPAILKSQPLPSDPRDDELARLLKERYNAAVAELKNSLALYEVGRGDFYSVAHAGRRVLDAGVEIWTVPKDRISLLASYVELATDNEKIAKARLEHGNGSPIDLDRATYERANAQIMLLREKRASR